MDCESVSDCMITLFFGSSLPLCYLLCVLLCGSLFLRWSSTCWYEQMRGTSWSTGYRWFRCI